MRKTRIAFTLAAAGAVWLACSDSNGPAPNLAGTWHVSVGTLDNGTISPATFDVVLTASGDTFLATIPHLTWSIGSEVFDTLVSVGVEEDSFLVVSEQSSARTCDFVALAGRANAARDTIHAATFAVEDTDNTGVYICKPKAQGSATAHK